MTNVELSPNAIYYFMLRHVFVVISLGFFAWLLLMENTVMVRADWVLVAFYAVILGGVWLYNRALARSYHIELRKEGISLQYGIVNLNNELLLFDKIQDIIITRNVLERLMGLSSLYIQNAMGQPEIIPCLGADTAEKMRDEVLGQIKR